MWNNLFHCLLSFVLFFGLAYVLSEDKKRINKILVLKGAILQIIFTVILLKVPAISIFFKNAASILESIALSTNKAVGYVFGGLANPPAELHLGYILAIQGFPILIIISGLSAVLTYWRILPTIIKFISLIYRKILNIGGTLGIASSINLFTGMSETPLIIRSYLKHLTHSELFSLMVCGTSGVSSSVIILYSLILDKTINYPIVHIINAVLISIPCALTLSRIVIPETSQKVTQGNDGDFTKASSTLDAIYNGLTDGAKVTVNIIVMLIGFVALIDIFNNFLQYLIPSSLNIEISLQKLFGFIAYPIAWVIGIPTAETMTVASLLGSKFILNEIIAFTDLANSAHLLSEKTKILSIYLLSSFANIGSIGVMIGVYSTLIPERKGEVLKLGVKSVIIGSFVSYITASIVNVVL